MQPRQKKSSRHPSRGVLAHVIPLDQLRAVHRLALLDLVPRLVADGRERRVRRQGPALSVCVRVSHHINKRRHKKKKKSLQIPVDRQRAPNLQIPMHLQRAIDLELAKDLDLVPKSHTVSILSPPNPTPSHQNEREKEEKKTHMQTTPPLTLTFPILFTFPPQLKFPSTSRFPYASIRSRTEKSPTKVTDAIDLTDPSTSIGPRSDSASSDLMDFFFLMAVEGWDGVPSIMGWSKVMICSYSYIVSVGGGDVGLVVEDVDGVGEGAAVEDVVVVVDGELGSDGEEAAVVVMVGVGVGADVDGAVVEGGGGERRGSDGGDDGNGDGDAPSSSFVSTSRGGVPFFMFPEAARGTAKLTTATLCDSIRLRDVARSVWPSCSHTTCQWWRESEVRVRDRSAQQGLGWSIGPCRPGLAVLGRGRRSGSYIESGNLERNETPSRGGGERCRLVGVSQVLDSPWGQQAGVGRPSRRPPPTDKTEPGRPWFLPAGTDRRVLHESLHPEKGMSLFSLAVATLPPWSQWMSNTIEVRVGRHHAPTAIPRRHVPFPGRPPLPPFPYQP